MRSGILAVALCASLVVGLTGCGKIPTWGELTGQQQPSTATATPAPPPSVPVQNAAPAGPSAAEVIANFNALAPGQVSDAAISQLTSLKEGLDQVTEINADGSAVTKAAFGAIEKLTNLRQLRLNGSRVDNEACQKIAMVSSLEVLALSDTAVSDVGVAALSGLQNLKQLELTRCGLTENGFRAIGNLPSLKSISIESTNMNNRMLDLVCNARTLTQFVMTSNSIDDNGLAALGKLETLEYLEMGHTAITGTGLTSAMKGGGLKKLLYLGLYSCPISNNGAKAISSIKSLERLNFGSIGMTDDGLKFVLAGMKNLKFLNLSKCVGINGSGLMPLQGSKSMEDLRIDQCPAIGDPVVKILKSMKNLKRVATGSTAITPRALSELQAALPDLQIN